MRFGSPRSETRGLRCVSAGLLLLSTLLLGASSPAHATIILSLVDTTALPPVLPADPVTIDVQISGLGNLASLSLGAYDLDVSFNAGVLNFVSVTFGTDLGGPGSSLQSSGLTIGGDVDLAEVSLLSSATLNANQPGAFVLATLNFTVNGNGTSPLNFTQLVLGDEFGSPLSATTSTVTVVVPEPSAGFLIGLALLGLALRRR